MSMDNIDQAGMPDRIDDLLNSAFDEALTGPGNQLLVSQVMAQIARRQRLRALLLAVVGFIALMICMLGAAPLFDLFPALFSGLFSSTNPSADSTLSLPLLAAVGMALAGAWLLMEEVAG